MENKNRPRFIDYECSKCDSHIRVELDINNLIYYKRPILFCKYCSEAMYSRIIKEWDIIKEENV